MTPHERKIRGADARQLLDNKLLKEALGKLDEHIDAQALDCAADDKDRAQRIVISKQLLAGLKRELYRLVQDGEIASVELEMIEKQSLARRMAQRLIR